MFKRTWKQLKILIFIIILLICLPHSILPHKATEATKEDIENYTKLNEEERRLIEFKDNEEALRLKIEQIDYINKSRKRNNAPPVKLDILASRVANKMAREAAENNYVGHYNMAGESPYQRYALAGGYDHVSENAYGEWTTDKYIMKAQTIEFKMRHGHEQFMAEKAPDDGHRQNIIEKSHTFAGIGFYLSENQFRYYEEFLDRHLDFFDIPAEVKIDEPFQITVKTNEKSFLYYLIVYRENYPQPLTPAEIKRKGNYADFTNEEYIQMPAWKLSEFRSGSTYSVPLKFSKSGLYYIQIFTDKKEISRSAYITTKGKSPESGIVIKVASGDR
jgi:uncharacterized protein YkwD